MGKGQYLYGPMVTGDLRMTVQLMATLAVSTPSQLGRWVWGESSPGTMKNARLRWSQPM